GGRRGGGDWESPDDLDGKSSPSVRVFAESRASIQSNRLDFGDLVVGAPRVDLVPGGQFRARFRKPESRPDLLHARCPPSLAVLKPRFNSLPDMGPIYRVVPEVFHSHDPSTAQSK